MSRLPIVCYHNVGPAPPGRFGHLHLDVTKLDRQCWAMRHLGLRGVSITEGLARMRDETRSNTVALTFDDGYLDTLTAALPVLKRYAFRATCYVVSDCVGAHNRWDDEAGRERQELMTQAQIGEWLAAGMEIASHSCTHPWLNRIDDETAAHEIDDSRAALQRTFGVAIDHFGYPFGGLTDRIVELVRRSGYASAVTTQPGIARASDHPLRLPRLLVRGDNGLGSFLLKVATPFEDLANGRGLFGT